LIDLIFDLIFFFFFLKHNRTSQCFCWMWIHPWLEQKINRKSVFLIILSIIPHIFISIKYTSLSLFYSIILSGSILLITSATLSAFALHILGLCQFNLIIQKLWFHFNHSIKSLLYYLSSHLSFILSINPPIKKRCGS